MKSGLFAVLLGGVLAVSVDSECVDTDETVPEGQRDCSFVESLGQESIKIRYCALTDAATFLKQREMCCVCGGGRTITTTPATTTVTTITTTTTRTTTTTTVTTVTETTATTITTTIATCKDTDTNIVGTQNCAWIEGQKDLEALLPGWIEDLCTGKVYDNGFKAVEMCCVCAAFSAADGSGSVGRSGSGSEGDDDDDIREPQETTTLPVSEELTVAPTQEPTALPSSTEAEEESKKLTKGEKIGLGLGLSFGLLILIMVLFTPHRSEPAEFEVPQPAAEEIELKSVKVAEPILVLEPDFFSKKILKKTKSTSV
jgi:hypothetical protein